MTRDLFTETLKAIAEQMEIDKKCSSAFSVLLPHDHITGYDNSALYHQLMKILAIETDDEFGWIEWFVYDTDFGRNKQEAYQDERELDLSTAEKLYDYLVNKK